MSFMRLIKLGISIAYFMTVRVLIGPSRQRYLIVFYYHAVRAHEVKRFREQVRAMASFGDVVDASDINPPNGRSRTAITFDDAFQCVFDNALPVLAEFNAPCTIFVPTANMGRTADWEMEAYSADKGEAIASEGTIKRVQSALVSFGAHSDTHPRLSRLDPENARREIFVPRVKLEQLLNRRVDLFAFPYGDYDDRVLHLTKEAGYKFAYSIGPGMVACGDTQLLRARVPLNPSDYKLEFWLKLRGGYNWMPVASRIKRHLLSYAKRGGAHTD